MTLDEFYKQTNKITTCFNELGFTDNHKPFIDLEIYESSNYMQYRVIDNVTSFAEFVDYINEELFYNSDDVKDNIKKFIIETLKTYDFSFTKDCYDDECKIYSEDIISYNDNIVIKIKIIYELS